MSADFNIIDNNEQFIVVEKPPGISFQDEEGQTGFFNQIKKRLNAGELYPVHRLDKLTSGLVIMAKTKDAARTFQQLFETRQIEKYYLALSLDKPKKKQGLIKGDMEKSRRGTWKLARECNNPAITQFFSYGIEGKARLFLLKPHTGKTHQLRVALKSIASPIAGDTAYNGKTSDRGYLHAFAMRFVFDGMVYDYLCHPTSGELFNELAVRQKIAELSPPWLQIWPKLK